MNVEKAIWLVVLQRSVHIEYQERVYTRLLWFKHQSHHSIFHRSTCRHSLYHWRMERWHFSPSKNNHLHQINLVLSQFHKLNIQLNFLYCCNKWKHNAYGALWVWYYWRLRNSTSLLVISGWWIPLQQVVIWVWTDRETGMDVTPGRNGPCKTSGTQWVIGLVGILMCEKNCGNEDVWYFVCQIVNFERWPSTWEEHWRKKAREWAWAFFRREFQSQFRIFNQW